MNLAKRRNIDNIVFKKMCLKDLVNYPEKFDFIYARWVLMYLKCPPMGINAMYAALKHGGIIACEDVDFSNQGVFSFPGTDVLTQWIDYWTENFKRLELKEIDFFNDIYLTMKNLRLSNFKLTTNQPILATQEEKSVLRLGMIGTKSSILKNKVATAEEYQIFLNEAEKFEKIDSVIGFVRNMLISAKK